MDEPQRCFLSPNFGGSMKPVARESRSPKAAVPACESLENRILFYTALPNMPSVQNTDQTVRFAAAADFNGDGRADILTRNYSTGANTIYLTNSVDESGAGFSIATIRATPNPDCLVAGLGDWNAHA